MACVQHLLVCLHTKFADQVNHNLLKQSGNTLVVSKKLRNKIVAGQCAVAVQPYFKDGWCSTLF